jgi:glutathione S-transferase
MSIGRIPVRLLCRTGLTGGFGLADIALGCTLELSPGLGYDLAPYEHVRAWLSRCQSRPSWRTDLKVE